jgi:hypothetical protein
LERRQLTEALTGQEEAEKDLLELLQLLESENREQRRTAEKEKIKEFLRNLEEIIHQEKSLKTKTAQKENEQLTPLEKEQKNVRLRTQTLRDQINENENPGTAPKDTSKEQEQKTEQKSASPENSNSENSENDSNNNSDKPEQPKEKSANNESDNNKAENNKSADSDSDSEKENKKGNQDSEKKSSQKSDEDSSKESSEKNSETDSKQDSAKDSNQKSDNSSPTQQAMQKALQRMNEAEKKLQKAEKSGALEDQEEAIAELQRVKAELEKILKQLREEEMLQTLEKLEARFKRMLRVEQSIRSQTEKTSAEAKNADESATRQIQIQASRIGLDQQSVIDDADAALILLREDGTAQAMVESLLQARFDMAEAKNRLNRTEIDSVTLDIEDAVIASLQEMLEAVELAIKEAEKRKENPQQKSSSGEGDADSEPLIQLLSELKMIRSMQQRVNERTERYEKSVDQLRNETNPDFESLRKKVEELTRQQNRISRILHDLKVGKAK